jgi:protein-L-isoaspartate O-methyltransferase
MLKDARLEPGMKILEAGTGTGWSAALAAHVTGPDTVVTIECDQQVAELAARNLNRGDHRARLVVGDAANGWPVDAPYDRVIATYGVRRVPRAWIAQTVPGGLVVAPWGTDYSYRDAVAVLAVDSDGTASGRFTGPVEFMKGRSERLPFPTHGKYMAASPDAFPDTTAIDRALGLADVIGSRDRWDPVVFITGMLVPGVTYAVDTRNRDAPTVWWYSLTDLSWVAATFHISGSTAVTHGGGRDLWGALKAAHNWWIGQGRPGVERFGITADGDGETVWLEDSGRPVPRFG